MNESIDNYLNTLQNLPRAFPKSDLTGDLRTHSSDFKVEEILAFSPCGEGEHLFLQIEKHDCNTDWVARQLQKMSGLTSRDIGYAGKKDRHSISVQWFSLHLPGKDIELETLTSDSFKILKAIRHNKKLRMGRLLENRFEIILRNVSGRIESSRITLIRKQGVPNYFGAQRFGFEADNLPRADLLLKKEIKIKNRNKRGLIISSARSFLFNLQLAERIKQDNWLEPIQGDCMLLNTTSSYFQIDTPSEDVRRRMVEGDIHVSGYLPGKQISDARGIALNYENKSNAVFEDWVIGLRQLNIESMRRAFRCVPKNLSVEQNGTVAVLKFSLQKGCYATSVIRELVEVRDKKLQQNKNRNSSGLNVNEEVH